MEVNYVTCKELTYGDIPFWEWIFRPEVLFYIAMYVITALLFFVVYIVGVFNPAFEALKLPNEDVWIARIAWVVAALISYGSFFFLYDQPPREIFRIYWLFLLGNLLLVVFAITEYGFRSLIGAAVIGIVIVLYNVGMFIYFWIAYGFAVAGWLIPLLIMYAYLAYFTWGLYDLNGPTY